MYVYTYNFINMQIFSVHAEVLATWSSQRVSHFGLSVVFLSLELAMAPNNAYAADPT